ncbi:MAG TPA: hypothetical protein VNW99_11060 [Cytophagaceae bacterium]|jgi:hypothetical protein|nr:hypothetical protein [Cytophagaceae bacterium]
MSPKKDIDDTVDKKKSPRRIIRGLFIILFLASIVFFMVINFLINSFVKHQIIKSVERSSRGLYHVEIGSLHAKFWSGAIHMKDVRLFQDSALFEYIQKTDTAVHLSHINVGFEAIDISSIKWRNYIRSNNLKVGKIDLHSPHFYMRIPTIHSKPEDSDKNFLDLLPGLIASFAQSLKIRELNVLSGELNFDLRYGPGYTHQTADHINLNFNEIEIDTFSTQKVIYSKDAIISFSNYSLITPHKDFTLKIKNGFGKLSDSILTLSNLDFKKDKDSLGKEILMDISIKEIKGNGLNFQTLIRNKKIDLRKLEFNSPDINIKTPYILKQKNKPTNDLPDIIPAFTKDFVDSLKIDTILLTDGRIKTDIENKSGHITQNAEKIKIEFIRFPTNENSVPNSIDEFAIVSMANYQLHVTGLNFKMQVGKVRMSTSGKDLTLENISMTQMHSHGPKQRYFFTNHIRNVHAAGLDFPTMIQNKKLIMDRLSLDDMDLKIFFDANKPSKIRNHNMPQALMSKIKFPIDIKMLKFNNANITYTDQEPDLKQAALSFIKSNVVMKNFTNDPKKMTAKTPAVAKGNTLVLGQGLINFNLRIPFLSKNFDCGYDGTVGKMNGVLFNDFMAMAGLRVDRGQIETSKFNVNIVNGKANGDIEFIYHDLHVKAIDKNTGQVKRKDSWLVNFVVKNDNPQRHGHEPEKVNVQTSISNDEGFFYFLWKVLRIGAVETMTKSTIYQQKK